MHDRHDMQCVARQPTPEYASVNRILEICMNKEKKQYSTPVFVSGKKSFHLERISLKQRGTEDNYDEKWIQDLIYEHPNLLPVEELEPAALPLIPVCRELATPSGYIDNIFINDTGVLTIVECKLWRNPDARRNVIGQILDYAKELSKLRYEGLNMALRRSTGSSGNVLFKIVSKFMENDIDECVFVDMVSRNLKNGHFLLLVVGDGIREDIENITDYLQKYANLRFSFGLIELSIHSIPGQIGFLVQPRILARTFSVERLIVRVESDSCNPVGILVEENSTGDKIVAGESSTKKRITLTEENFNTQFKEKNPDIFKGFENFIKTIDELDVVLEFGSSSIQLRWYTGEVKMNFGSIKTDGFVDTWPCAWGLANIDRQDIAMNYMNEISTLIPDSFLKKSNTGKNPEYRVCMKNGGSKIHVRDLLQSQEKWVELIRKTQDLINTAVHKE